MARTRSSPLQFESRRCTRSGATATRRPTDGYQQTWEATRAQPGRRGILVDYTGGGASRDQSGQSVDALAGAFLDQIAPVLPGLVPSRNGAAVRAAFDDWPANPYSLGSYAFWKVGQYTAFAGAEGEAVDGCHFAGEHTSVDAQGYLEGAVESGARAAREVLAGVGGGKRG
jgi:monoamine oxidase